MVKCSDCGYLCILSEHERFLGERSFGGGIDVKMPQYEYETGYLQIYELERKEPLKLKVPEHIHCYRRVFDLAQEAKALTQQRDIKTAVKSVMENPRNCRYHVQYIAGYSPAHHLTRWENIEREWMNRRWNFVYLLIGSVITVLGALAIKLIFG